MELERGVVVHGSWGILASRICWMMESPLRCCKAPEKRVVQEINQLSTDLKTPKLTEAPWNLEKMRLLQVKSRKGLKYEAGGLISRRSARSSQKTQSTYAQPFKFISKVQYAKNADQNADHRPKCRPPTTDHCIKPPLYIADIVESRHCNLQTL